MMASGIFLVGERLSLEGFNHYVKSWFQQNNQGEVRDTMAVRGEEQRVLVSIVGEDIERNLNSALNYASVEADMDQKKHNSHCPNWRSSGYVFGNAWLKPKEEPRGLYRILGIYSDSEAASKIFPQIAIEYAANAAQHEIERLVETIEDEIKSISNRFKVK